MAPARLPERHRDIRGGGLAPLAAPTKPSGDPGRSGLTICPLIERAHGHVHGARGHGIPTPIRRVVRFGAVGSLIRRHDVSGTGWQTVGLIMLPTTTMMPMWQCGHARNDRPVSAS
jgi:hypothetical protein